MTKELIKISNDKIIPSVPMEGNYCYPNHQPLHGIYLKTNMETYEKLFISNGNLLKKYEYPRIEEKYTSPLLTDYNLHLSGGWSWPGVANLESVTRVLELKKPMGIFRTRDKLVFDTAVRIIKDHNSKEENTIYQTAYKNKYYTVTVASTLSYLN
ncbi:MAG: hypothetical protein P9L92_03435 [Candidatus Electryonea clarkiae]|nr:hypothetical protein [Candidatus Electryonea clarkiae]MDP8285957.1 hypothetical protein [Candidatus Electryonea clarkiae]